jgi:DNA-binding GntR family transcriptional regulator
MRQRAYRHIYELIASGALKGGSALSELSLAETLGSSRTPIREAIGQLIAEGLLEQTPVGTVLVVQLNRQDVHELYELREALEVFAIEKTTRSPLSTGERAQLQQSIDELWQLRTELASSCEAALNIEQMGRFLASDLAFHSLLVSLAHNTRIQRVVNEMRLLIRIFAIQRRGHGLPMLEAIHQHHQKILDAVVQGDAYLARKLLSEHIRNSLRERLDEFDHWRREESLKAMLQG